MRSLVLATILLLSGPDLARAQSPLAPPRSGSGAGPQLIPPGPNLLMPPLRPGYPFGGVWGGMGFVPWPGYGLVGPGSFGNSFSPFAPPRAGVSVPLVATGPAEPTLVLANEFPATLTLEFPAPAEVWVNGLKATGEPQREWTLTSPTLKAGGEYTFAVKARWQADGNTLEYTRSHTVAGGQRSRAFVLAGTPLKQ